MVNLLNEKQQQKTKMTGESVMTGAFSCRSKVKSAPAVLAGDPVLMATFTGTQGNLIQPAAMGESQHYSSQ